MAFGLFQAETFCHMESDKIFPWLKQLQETQIQLQHMLFGVTADLLAKHTGLHSCIITASRLFKPASACGVRVVILSKYRGNGDIL